MNVPVQKLTAAEEGEIPDEDRDSLHTLPIAILPAVGHIGMTATPAFAALAHRPHS